MQTNYYFLVQLSKKLNQILPKLYLISSFSQEKNEIIFEFSTSKVLESDASSFFIRTTLNPDFVCLSFPENFKRANYNSANIFENLIGARVEFVVQHANERAFSIKFSKNFILTFKLFGNKSNLILYENENVVKLFKNIFVGDNNLKYNSLERKLEATFSAFQINDFNIQKTFPIFGKDVIEVIQYKYGEVCNGTEIEKKECFNYINILINNFAKPQFYLTTLNGQPKLSLLKIGTISEVFDDPILALNAFYLAFMRYNGFAKEKNEAILGIQKQIIKYQQTIQIITKRIQEFTTSIKNEEIANIIMANLHLIDTKNNSAELFDFYRDKWITIKLKKDVLPQKNAENYYRKAKNEKTELLFLENSILDKTLKIKELNVKLDQVIKVEALKELRKITKINQLEKAAIEKDELPFKVITVDGWQIWVGKNATNNDLLTQKYAKKDDLWLHARDVSGSHVIIRFQAGKVFPKNVINRAAEIAAFYSKRKTDTTCSVIVTPKKFVRKPKNFAAGKVIVEKEETLLVTPTGP